MSNENLRSKAWKEFSEFTRTKDLVDEVAKCCTCAFMGHWKLFDAGHFIPGRSNSLLFVEENCHAQCRKCNREQRGNYGLYYNFMLEKYGPEKIDQLKSLKNKVVKFYNSDYLKIINDYKIKKRLGL